MFFLPAAFGRLCVETCESVPLSLSSSPAAFGRLCVETCLALAICASLVQPPSGGCVLKQNKLITNQFFTIPAAFGRLCVETTNISILAVFFSASRLRAAVC